MISVVYTGTREPATVEGIELHHLPMLERIALPLPDDLLRKVREPQARSRIVIFYSQNAAQRVLDEFDAEDFSGFEVWAVGAKTAGWLSSELGRSVHRPARQDFAGLVDELKGVVDEDTFVVSFELEGSDRRLADEDLPGDVQSVAAYETVACNWDDLDGLLRRIGPQWVVFSSPRGFSAFVGNLHHRTIGDSYRVAVIGPNTRDEVQALGGRVDFVPASPDVATLLYELTQQ